MKGRELHSQNYNDVLSNVQFTQHMAHVFS